MLTYAESGLKSWEVGKIALFPEVHGQVLFPGVHGQVLEQDLPLADFYVNHKLPLLSAPCSASRQLQLPVVLQRHRCLDDLELAEPVVWVSRVDFGAMGHQKLACRKIECGVGFRAFGYHEGFPFKEVGKIAHKHWYCLWASPVSKACR